MLNKEPWPHIVIDNFLDDSLYNKIVEEVLSSSLYSKVLDENKIIAGNVFDTDGNIIKNNRLAEVLDFDTILTLYEDYYPKCMDILKLLSPEKINMVKHFDVSVTVCGKNYTTESVHVDHIEKMLSVVVYLHPDNSFGTILFTHPDGNGIMTEWKENRAMAFSRENNTWHSYKSNNEKRVTLLINLNTGFYK